VAKLGISGKRGSGYLDDWAAKGGKNLFSK